jgi:dethiobiotin synthetase
MSPLSDDDYNADLAAELGYPLVVIAENRLGTINATLQTLITAATYCDGLAAAGVVLNSPRTRPDDSSLDSNRDELERRCVSPVLATVSYGGQFDRSVDWWELSREQGAAGTEC